MNEVIIENKSGKIKLNESVTRQSINRMIEEIGKLFGATAKNEGADFGEIMNAAENGIDVLNIEINSPGGSIFDGYTIYQEIRSLRDRGVVVNATITGMAASMASVICMACDEVEIVPHGRMMIHEASTSVNGNAEALRKTADLLDGISQDIAAIYTEKTGKPVDEIRALMKEETWMNAADCVALKFADKIVKKTVDVASIHSKLNSDMSIFGSKKDLELAQNQIDSLSADLTTIQAELATERETVAAQAQSIADLQASFDALTTERDNLTASLEAANNRVAELENAVVTAEQSAEEKAVTLLASAGHEKPLEISEAAETSVFETYQQLKKTNPAKATAYWNENKQTIIQQSK